MASSVQRGAARHDQAVSTAAVRGAPRATVQIPAWLASSWLLAQYGVSISAAPMSGSSPTASPTGPSSATAAVARDGLSARRSYARRRAGPPVAARRVVPLRRGPHPADAHRRGDDVRGGRRWFRLRRVRRPHRAPAGAGAALAPEGARGARSTSACRCGWTTPTSTSTTTSAAPPCPRPGTDEQLRALVGRLVGRRLDRSRPLWEIYLVEGLADGRFAVVTKTHHAMVDGLASMDVGALLLDVTPDVRDTPPDDWCPAPEPSSLDLATDAVREAMAAAPHGARRRRAGPRGRPRGRVRRGAGGGDAVSRSPRAARCTRSTR